MVLSARNLFLVGEPDHVFRGRPSAWDRAGVSTKPDEFMEAEGHREWPSIAVYFYRDGVMGLMGDIGINRSPV